jgi:Leucine-rich repeat (LRR) protein
MSACLKLKEIRASRNFIVVLRLSKSNVVSLDFSGNKLKTVEISSCFPLETLKLSENELSDFPNLSTVPSLKTIDLSHNQIATLPEAYNFSSLANLNLAYNKIRMPIPSALFTTTMISNLLLMGNNVTQVEV